MHLKPNLELEFDFYLCVRYIYTYEKLQNIDIKHRIIEKQITSPADITENEGKLLEITDVRQKLHGRNTKPIN